MNDFANKRLQNIYQNQQQIAGLTAMRKSQDELVGHTPGSAGNRGSVGGSTGDRGAAAAHAMLKGQQQ